MLLLPLLCCGAFAASAQIRMLPRQRVDSLLQAEARPKQWAAEFLEFDSLYVNLGTAHEKSGPLKAIYRFRNAGESAIAIGRAETSCGCVKASVSPLFLRPDSTATLQVIYDPRGHSGRHPRYISLFLREPVDTCVARLVLDSFILE